MSRGGSLAAALRLLAGKITGKGSIPGKLKKEAILLHQLGRQEKVTLLKACKGEDSSMELLVKGKPVSVENLREDLFWCKVKVPLKDSKVRIKISENDTKEILQGIDEDERKLVKIGSKPIEGISTGVVIMTCIEYLGKIFIGVKDFVEDPRSWVENIVNKAKKEKVSQEAILKTRGDIEKLMKHFGIDEDNYGNEEKKKGKEEEKEQKRGQEEKGDTNDSESTESEGHSEIESEGEE